MTLIYMVKIKRIDRKRIKNRELVREMLDGDEENETYNCGFADVFKGFVDSDRQRRMAKKVEVVYFNNHERAGVMVPKRDVVFTDAMNIKDGIERAFEIMGKQIIL